jgi:hypothetical protein
MQDISHPQPGKKQSLDLATILLGSVSFFSLLLPNFYGVLFGPICGIVGIILARKHLKISRETSSLVGLITSIIGTACWGLVIIILAVLVINAYA